MTPSTSLGMWRVTIRFLAAAMALSAMFDSVYGDLIGPTELDREISISVTKLLSTRHLSQRPLDDEISRRFLKKFLDTLDPWKFYFSEFDVAEFLGAQDDLGESLSKAGCGRTVYRPRAARPGTRMTSVSSRPTATTCRGPFETAPGNLDQLVQR